MARISGELNAKEFTDAEFVVLKLSQKKSFDKVKKPRFNTLHVCTDKELIRLKSPVIARINMTFDTLSY